MHVQRRFLKAVVPGGILLDLQIIPPYPRVEAQGKVIHLVHGGEVFDWALAAGAALDRLVDEGRLLDEAYLDHDVLSHYENGAVLCANWPSKLATLPPEVTSLLSAVSTICVLRERCRLRKLVRPKTGEANTVRTARSPEPSAKR